MSTARRRTAHAEAILGPELHARLPNVKVLLVGAGGIGCELLKNIVLTGFGKITLLDLDTIDVSNLNRQFLFRKKDVKQSKALVAAQTAGSFNPNVKITPIFANIKDTQYDIEWFQSFDLVLNALDNLDARRHVNKMCMAANVPLVESGTAGYLGQVQPLVKDLTECFDCMPKPTPKTFPVCTIRSTPSQPIHCIVWSKSYLMGQLFGEDEDASGELDEAEKQGENAQEIATLREQAQAFMSVRKALRTPSKDAARMVFQKQCPTCGNRGHHPFPLEFDAILDDTFVLRQNGTNEQTRQASTSRATNGHSSAIKDQRTLSLRDNVLLFVSSTERLAARLQAGEETISFDKDDDDTLDFVTASSNLRSAAYGIEGKTRWEVKEMAGNIIPAIATTNAIVSGLIVLQALHLLRKSYSSLRSVHILANKPSVPLSAIRMCPPNPSCGVCRDTYTKVLCDTSRTTLGDVVKGIMGNDTREVSVYEDKRVLSDPDWEDNFERTLESLNVSRGKLLAIADEEGEWGTITVALGLLPESHPPDAPPFILPSPLPKAPRKPKQVALPDSPVKMSTLKRPAPTDDDVEPSAKRVKVDALSSPSKKQRLEEDGIILMDGADDRLEDDIIVID
ncbi:uncharacterized protein EV420DRAFT_1621956 [Desarmillaria tabescens]|uniref:Ubiquitin-activating enzyme E1-like n=1 Tax=Armillaria tabescens TaxID=1929756 RepID=A0AA39JWX7_ARMTA|nr:uncharacterized protein EV420DRAFT_1621956 [Desarmillaria tabescens]KAK0450329.1 hypothetical protein EV420DRAFT_1621956 [Desarmillaria tabescens]